MSMNDKHVYIDEKGVEWERQWCKPQASFNVKIDPFSAKDFVAKTATKKGETIGDLIDRSMDAKVEREAKLGHADPVREKRYAAYSEATRGKKHPQQIKEAQDKIITI